MGYNNITEMSVLFNTRKKHTTKYQPNAVQIEYIGYFSQSRGRRVSTVETNIKVNSKILGQ
jgi:hypothetical protein